MPNSPVLPRSQKPAQYRAGRSVLAWPAWLRVLVVAPTVALLWLAVLWANLEVAPW